MTAIIAGMIKKPRGHHYTVLWSDSNSENILNSRFADYPDITFLNPVGSSNNMKLFLWQMTKLKRCLRDIKADVLVALNHHFPIGDIPQIIYHVNVLRFERPHKLLLVSGELANRLRDWRANCALKKAHANVFESSFLQDLALTKVNNIQNPNLIYIGLENPNKVTPSKFKKTNNPFILSLTSAQPHKDNPTLIKALAVLNTRRTDVNWRLKIAGGANPTVFTDLHDLAEKLGVAKQIEWLGFLRHDKLARLGSEALCLVSTSRVESFSMVALEAMSWSCPTIVSNATSMPESIGNAGLLAEPGHPEDFANKIISLYDNNDMRLRLVNNGYLHIKAMTWLNAADSFADIIADLRTGKG